MSPQSATYIATMAALGTELGAATPTPAFREAVQRAIQANPWFMPEDIRHAARALADDMLQADKLTRWLAAYDIPAATQRTVGIVMAGNLPMVGFHDLLCVLAAGHRCLINPSSKDRAMTDYLIGRLRQLAPGLPLAYWHDEPVDAVIATGSDNTNRYFRSRFHDIPALLRGSRHSVAVLTGQETDDELQDLAEDMFRYNGMGCRSVSRLFVPPGYDIRALAATLGRYRGINPKYRNNYRQARALALMQGSTFTDGGFFLLVPADGFPDTLSKITYSEYRTPDEVQAWLATHDRKLQCIVGRDQAHPRGVAFGRAQHPSLTDYADGRDTMQFLTGLTVPSRTLHSNSN